MLRIWFRAGVLLLAVMILAVQTNAAPATSEDETEREVTLNEVPAKVKATILKAAGKNEIKEVEEVVLRLFEVEWRKGEKEIEVLLKPDGEVLMKKVEKADEEEGAGEQPAEKEEEAAEEDDGESDEKEIGIEALPAKVKAAVKKIAGTNQIELEELHVKFYEAAWMQDGKEVEILVATDGTPVRPEGRKAVKEGKGKGKKQGKDKEDKDDEDKENDQD